MKRSYLFPRVGKQDILFQFADELSIDTGSETYMITADSTGIWLSCGPLAEDVTHDPVKIVADLIGCSTKELEPMLRQHFAERTGKKATESLEHVIVNALPGLAALVARVPTLTVPLSISPRLRRALANPDSRESSRVFFQDHSSRSDGQAFATALVNGTEIDESRASMLALIGVGDLRREVASVDCPVSWVTLPTETSAITEGLSPRAQVDFTVAALSNPRSRFVLTAARRCGLKATGNDGAAAFHRLHSEVQVSEFSFPRTPGELLIAGGPIAGLTVRKALPVTRELKALGDATRTCLGNPAHSWMNRIVRGEVELMTLHNNQGEIVAMIALGPTGEIREAKTPGNGQVPDEILAALKLALKERT